ncbi:MAG: NAD(P)-dependent oxidoreductase [Rhodospirillaceae bacterium]|jgi:3-hydroxyisobutyrate dehydrogenase-like beta-hydroxyacid dehydrogenase|nr:NAD(P)-dependent oxidoreductase [Rhodospirillaceae bacterium]MBT6403277.1 NAD(P)-dependent oxidoreductase [Rhodospirillaceae bacterium]MBT6536844.1 NAD(P)-dependent oxidoreductase [Rhodospirillaceae bacterium]
MAHDTKVGWIGVGMMGEPMARNVMQAGFPLTVYNRTRDKVRDLENDGAGVADRIADLASDCDVLVSMISADAALEAITVADGGAFAAMSPGSVFIDMSTVSPAMSARVAVAAKEKGIHYLRAPVSGSIGLAAAGTLTIFASGPEAVFEDSRSLFEAMGAKLFHVGEAEESRFLKLSINMMVGITAGMMAEALTLSEKGGVDWNQMIDIIGSSAVGSPLVGYKVDALKNRDFTPAFPAWMMSKDFDLALDAARDESIPLPITSLVRQHWSAMEATGRGEMDFFAYVTLMEHLSGLGDGADD